MLTHVYDKITETMYYVTNINLIDEEYLVSVDDADIAYFNVPFTITETKKNSNYIYAIADVSNYRNEKNTPLYDCEYRDNVLIFSYPDKQSLAEKHSNSRISDEEISPKKEPTPTTDQVQE